MLLETINAPADLRRLDSEQLEVLASEIRDFVLRATSITGGHLGSNLGVVELTLALHRVFDSPRDVVLWDTGHQAYIHKLVTGRRESFDTLRQAGGLSGYPSRTESDHDWVENSHASTILSYAHGLSTAFQRSETDADRAVIAVIGDGAMTGGMAYEALNNLGHSRGRVVIVLNDNGRSYAPTISRLSASVTRFRLSPSYLRNRRRVEQALSAVPLVGDTLRAGVQGLRAGMREVFGPKSFFQSLGVRYVGPVHGHDIDQLELVLRRAADHDGPILVHVLTQKGRGYSFAEDDEEKCLHDVGIFDPMVGPERVLGAPGTYTEAFTEALLEAADADPRITAITAAMPGPTGLLPFQERFPQRFLDVGIAEQHAVTAAAGMAMGGLRPVVAVYSTFFTRAMDQANLDVGLHRLPVTFCLDRAGVTGDDGPSHHGVLDLALALRIPGLTVFAPSSAQELKVMLAEALSTDSGPTAVRYPKGPARQVSPDEVGSGLSARLVREGGDVCILAVGKMLEAAEDAALLLREQDLEATVWDVRLVRPLDRAMLVHAGSHPLVVTVEDGIRTGGAGSAIADALASLEESCVAPPVLVLGTPECYIPQGKPGQILSELGLDGPGVAASIAKTLGLGATRLRSVTG